MKTDINIVDEYMQNNCITTGFLDNVARYVVELLRQTNNKIATAESLTGGMISQYITSVSGSSEIFELGITSYTDRIKAQELNVDENILREYSAVSEQTAKAMALGVKEKSGANITVAVTGLAGPTGGTPDKPVGTVYVAVISDSKTIVLNLRLNENFTSLDREKIRMLTVAYALEMVAQCL